MDGTINENEARYIVRMIFARQENCLFLDATDKDDEELDRIKDRYQSAGRWSAGRETSFAEFILRIAEHGVPGGKYVNDEPQLSIWMKHHEMPFIERPKEVIAD